MVSRVPSYGHLEYLVLELLFDLITILNEFCSIINVNLGLSWGYLLNIVIKPYS